MPRTSPNIVPKPHPTGTRLIRIADVPLEDRLAALHHLMSKHQLSTDEAIIMLDIALDPQDTSARIAA